MLKWKAGDGLVRIRNSMGHPLLWWTTSIAIFLTTMRLFFFGAATELGHVDGGIQEESEGFYFRHRRAAALLALMWWAYVSPWVLTLRDSYINHYLPSYAFGLLLTAGALAWLHQRWPRLATGVLVALLAVGIVYAPIWGQFAIDPGAIKYWLFIKGWR
jgi:dolichyl-phosphate-mannose--protein O-mannosyl transferase